jgi:hypothetical protein
MCLSRDSPTEITTSAAKDHVSLPAAGSYTQGSWIKHIFSYLASLIQCVPLPTEPAISLIILPLMRLLGALQTHTTGTFLFISHTTNVPLFKFRCNIFIGVKIIKEMPGLVASGTHCINFSIMFHCKFRSLITSLIQALACSFLYIFIPR